ncbi:MAG: DNA topoisomerase IV subunit B, partial [Myxococcales bacterium]|nr:DNA topoisomerase IV subunit B [Myxococcales bacterium]
MSGYGTEDITVLEGLEPVRQRPAMYIGDTAKRGYHHLLWEIVDNCVDEAINGHATTIEVELDADRKGATVTDNGRGIPVGMMKKYNKSALELILTTLHAGGKFGQGNYQVSGGLHGVGSSVVNALSEAMTADVFRDNEHWTQSYVRGKPQKKIKKVGETRGKRGTKIHFRPDPEIFGDKIGFDPTVVFERLEAKSYLHAGLKVVFKDPAANVREELHHPGGVVEYLGKLVDDRKKRAIPPEPFVFAKEDVPRIEVALTWTEAPEERLLTFANGIPTPSGGTHEAGLKSALNRAVRSFIDVKGISIKGVTISAEDIREGVVALLSVYVENPQFQGQTKD